MRKRKLGNSGLEVTPLCLGGNVFGWTIDEAASFQVLDAFVAAGFDFIDTADVYSRWAPGNQGGESETILGSWLKRSGMRDKVVIATKVGMEMGPNKKGLAKPYILQAVEDSQPCGGSRPSALICIKPTWTMLPLRWKRRWRHLRTCSRQEKCVPSAPRTTPASGLLQALAVSQKAGLLVQHECLQPPSPNLSAERADYEAKLEPLNAWAHGIGVISYCTAPGQGISDGQISLGERLGQERARARGQGVSERTRISHSRRSRSSRQGRSLDAARG